jgi:WD40 repeat protein
MRTAAALLILGLALRLHGQAPADAALPQEIAQGYFDSGQNRQALAVLAAAARKDPTDRTIAAMLYKSIRDHAWHFLQTPPTRHMGPVTVLAFSPDGTLLASGALGGQVYITPTAQTDGTSGGSTPLHMQVPDDIVGLAFSADGKRLAVASRAGWLRIWDLADDKITFIAPRIDVTTTAFASARGADLVAIGMGNGAIETVDLRTQSAQVILKQSGTAAKTDTAIRALAFSRSGGLLAAALGNGNAAAWQTDGGKRVRDYHAPSIFPGTSATS